MTTKWTQFSGGVVDAETGDVLVGLKGGVTNQRFSVGSLLQVALDLSDLNNPATAFNNISPLTTNGDVLVFAGGVNARLAVGTNGQVFAVSAGAPAWIANPAALKAANLSDVANAITSFNG